MSWVVWEEQTCDQIDRLYRAVGSWVMRTDPDCSGRATEDTVEHHCNHPSLCRQIPLRTTWMGRTIKLLDFVGKCHISFLGKFVKIRFIRP